MPIAASSNLTLDRGADWAKVLRIVDNNGDPVPLNPAVLGAKQVETNTVGGFASVGGNYGVTFISALTGTLNFAVPVLTGDNETTTALRAAAAMNDDEVFSAFWIATSSGPNLVATSKFFRANDPTCSLRIGVTALTTATGYTQDLLSANTTLGKAQVFGEFVFEGQLKLRPGTPALGDFVFEVIGDGTAGQVRIWLPYPITLRLAANSYHFDWLVYRNGYRFRTVRGQATVRGDITVPGTYVFPSTPGGSNASVEWGEIGGTLSNQIDLAAALAAKLSNITGYVSAGTNVSISGDGTSISPYVISATGGGGGTVAWGDIIGTVGDQADLGSIVTQDSDSVSISGGALAGVSIDDAVLGNTTPVTLTSNEASFTGTVTFTNSTFSMGGSAASNLRTALGFSDPTVNIAIGDIICESITASASGSTLSFSGGAIVLTQAAPNLLYINSAIGTDITGPIFYHQGSDATGDIYYRDSSGQLKRLAIGSGVLSVSGGIPAWSATPSLTYHRFGSGTPEGVVTAPVGAIYSRTDGGAGTSLYVKESGAGNTGWVAK